MAVNGTKYAPEQKRVSLSLQGKQVIEIEIKMSLRLISPGFVNRGKYAVAYGPLVMAVDECPQGWTLDEAALKLDSQTILKGIDVQRENGWPFVRVPAARIPAGICEVKSMATYSGDGNAMVKLRPVMFAGLGKNLEFAQSLKAVAGMKYDRAEAPKEYRVLVPCFFTDK
jgi:hypothetical protein